jgi:hypothetical protein
VQSHDAEDEKRLQGISPFELPNVNVFLSRQDALRYRYKREPDDNSEQGAAKVDTRAFSNQAKARGKHDPRCEPARPADQSLAHLSREKKGYGTKAGSESRQQGIGPDTQIWI